MRRKQQRVKPDRLVEVRLEVEAERRARGVPHPVVICGLHAEV